MSNTKISQLPLYSGTAADLRWFVMNNSGETQTFRFSGYTSPYIVDAVNSIFSTFGTPAVYNPTQCVGSVVIGSEAVAYDDYSTVIGWKAIGNNDIEGRCVALGADAQAQGRFSTALGMSTRVSASNATAVGYNATASGDGAIAVGHTSTASGQNAIAIGKGNTCTAANSSVIGGFSNTISSGNYNAAFGGSINSFGAGVASSTITAAYNNTNIQGLNLCFIAATQDNTITSMGYTYALIGGGYNTVNATNASAGNAMYSSYFCTDSTINSGGNSNNWFSGSRDCGQTGYGKYNWITNSYNSNINNNTGSEQNEWFNKIDSSSASTITTSKSSQIIGGKGNTISGKTDVVMVGTSGRTANADYTTYVENLHTYRTPSTQVQPVLSGTVFTCNIDNGAKSQFYITGTSTINITNVRDGASFMVKTQTDGNYNMTWTATGGYTFVFEGGIKDPGNNVTDIFVFEVFGSVIYGNRRHNYS